LDLDKLLERAGAIFESIPKMRTENRESTKISVPTSSSLAAEDLVDSTPENNMVEEEDEKIEPCQLQSCPMTRK
jgi:hypothetical protein